MLLLLIIITLLTPVFAVAHPSDVDTIARQAQSVSLLGITPFFGRSEKEIGLLAYPKNHAEIIAFLNNPKLHHSANGTQLITAIIESPGTNDEKEALWYSVAHACMCVHSVQQGTRPLASLYEQAWRSLNDRIPSMVYSVLFSGIGGAIVGALNNCTQRLTGARIGASSAAITTGMIALTLAILSHLARFHFKTMIALVEENLRHLLVTYEHHLPDSLRHELITLFSHLTVPPGTPHRDRQCKKHNELLAFYRAIHKKSEFITI